MMTHASKLQKQGLYDPAFEHDACGVGFVANIQGVKSHDILEQAIHILDRLIHRGAVDADAKSGDGAGVLTQIPEKLFQREMEKLGFHLPTIKDLAVGMIFLPRQDPLAHERCCTIIEETLAYYELPLFGWRPVPVDPSAIGDKALATMPQIQQILLGRPQGLTDQAFEQHLYLVRKEIEHHVAKKEIKDFYIPSFSHRTLVYKGLFVGPQLKHFYLDLRDPIFETALALFHQRYSTNTFPNWFLAQPFRMLGHNGEINTLRGNRNWMRAREPELYSPVWGSLSEKLKPVIDPDGSDSMSLDNVLELLTLSGRNPLHAIMCLIPEAHQNMPQMDPELRGCYQYLECLSEPWDGPAAVAFSDGVTVGATLDRNGLRPARYKVTEDGLVVMASEVGVLHLEDSRVVKKGRLGPGQMIAVDTAQGRLLTNEEIKREISRQKPYAEWIRRNLIYLETLGAVGSDGATSALPEDLLQQQKAFAYTAEDVDLFIKPMVVRSQESVGSMGDDTPLSVLSHKPRLLYTYFKQLFAQVTNPPIDPLREQLVMSLATYLGRQPSLLAETEHHARQIKLPSPILTNEQLQWLRNFADPDFQSITLSTLFSVAAGKEGLETALEELRQTASSAVDKGKTILILSDRGVNPEQAPIPMLLAVGAVHHHLIREGKRMRASLVAETGEPREEHHFATLLGYGASAINPYLAFATITYLVLAGDLNGTPHGTPPEKALTSYQKTVEKGILKIMSKMGISTVSSYRGAQIFEVLGLSRAVIDTCFTGTPSRIGGVGFAEVAADVLHFHTEAFAAQSAQRLEESGYFRFRKSGEFHAFNPSVFKALHRVARSGQYTDHKAYTNVVADGEESSLRDLLTFKPGTPIPLEEVEPIEDILHRFTTSSMSHGALSREAHETLAIAMNRIGAKSGSGEGGEDPTRYHRHPNGDLPSSAIKQVASGRFGVTAEYLASAKELEIKMAQGSKPGEGGQLPGHKVTTEIAKIRHSVPGATLISPPPHHDIYSIEDLAQLIYDLKHANPRAKVAVKLVAEAGVGTIAAGVAKAYADVIHISGCEGGTGASPLSSIKNAGVSWELGLAETQQVLVLNDLRGRVMLRVDGGFRTGRDVTIAAMFGAEEYGFGSAPIVAIGCVMARQCHLNTCPVGIATQDPTLRAKFSGTPEMVINFMVGVAQEVREILASLGFRSLNEVIGRPELLQPKDLSDHPKAATLDLSIILAQPDPAQTRPRYHIRERNDRIDNPLDDLILQDAKDALAGQGPIILSYEINNTHRAVGAKLAGEIAFRYGDKGLPEGTIECHFRGSAGQSFGAFCVPGLRLILTGEANDYIGKGMTGGELVIKLPATAHFRSHENVIMGNTVMYGATGGTLYAAGQAGERFCIRNSGGCAVVEGVGDHGCEYMTGGVVVILGETGRNFGAGMTSGTAYVLDEAKDFSEMYNPQLVSLEPVTDDADLNTLLAMIRRHAELTGSKRSREVLSHWDSYLPLFWKVVPHPTETLPARPPKRKAKAEKVVEARANA
jgi:glutamate synthase (NADPH/NADH) large chain/glutamate synthase (ferredoxin)